MRLGKEKRKTRGRDQGKEIFLRGMGRQIVRLREMRGWARKELARELRVNHERLGRWERGERQPPLPILFRLKVIFGVSVDGLDLPEPMTAPEW